jgi:hypothetical protein
VLILCRGWLLRSTRRGWEKCAGVRGPKGKATYHDAHGSPIINNSTFPDMKGLVKATADAGGVLDWYLNNCGPCPSIAPGHITQDVAAWDALGFGGTKVDGCDVAKNISDWYQALLKTSKPFLLVRTPQTLPHHLCNTKCQVAGSKLNGDLRWGVAGQDQCDTHWPANQQPTREHCPYHTFRTSNDIAPTFSSVVWNIQSILPFVKPQPQTISGPNCWAQPDMLEVGNTKPPNGAPGSWKITCPVLTHAESQIHFGLWCVTSAPLIIGHDVTNATMTDAVIDLLANTEAIAVNQVHHNHPGWLVRTSNATFSTTVYHGASCDIKDPPSKLPSWQVWAKMLREQKVAVLVANYDPAAGLNTTLTTSDLGFSAAAKISTARDVWAHADLPAVSALSFQLGARSSAFRVFSVV